MNTIQLKQFYSHLNLSHKINYLRICQISEAYSRSTSFDRKTHFQTIPPQRLNVLNIVLQHIFHIRCILQNYSPRGSIISQKGFAHIYNINNRYIFINRFSVSTRSQILQFSCSFVSYQRIHHFRINIRYYFIIFFSSILIFLISFRDRIEKLILIAILVHRYQW